MLSLRGKVDYVLVLIVKNYNEVTFDFTPFFKRKKNNNKWTTKIRTSLGNPNRRANPIQRPSIPR